MEDRQIVDLFLHRDERAIEAAAERYAAYCASIIRPILSRHEDVEECLNDTWLRAWNAIPPHRPNHLDLFLGKISRELALDRYRTAHRKKRGGGEVALTLEELGEITGPEDVEHAVETKELAAAVSAFLQRQPELQTAIFLRRYFDFWSIKELAEAFSMGESGIKLVLFRLRKRLKSELEREGLL